jgi:hypothetical protein
MIKSSPWTCLQAILATAILAAATTRALAAPLDPALQAQLMQTYGDYNQAIRAGKLDQAMALRDNDTRQSMQKDLASGGKRSELLAFARAGVPDSVEVRHASLSKDGATASIIVLAKKNAGAGAASASEVTLSFVKEGSTWKFGEQMFGIDPAKVVACRSQTFDPIDAYDQDTTSNLGGPIVRVAFEADHTLVIIRVLDEENCVFLPSRAELEKSGFKTDLLVPYTVVEIEGFQHKSDKQKIWADRFDITDR